MQSFEYYAPTEIIFGKGAEAQTGKAVKKWGGTRVLLVYGEAAPEEADFWKESKKNWMMKIYSGRNWEGYSQIPDFLWQKKALKRH